MVTLIIHSSTIIPSVDRNVIVSVLSQLGYVYRHLNVYRTHMYVGMYVCACVRACVVCTY